MNPSQSEVQVAILKTIEGEEKLREEWNQLVLQMEAPQIFFTYEWALAVERVFQSALQPWIYVIRKQGRPIGLAALAHESSDPQKIFFLNAGTGDYCDVISAPANRSEVVAALLKTLHESGIDEAVFASIPKDSTTVEALAQSRHAGYWSASLPAYVCRRIVFDRSHESSIPQDAALKSPKNERLRRLSKLGQISLEHLHTQQEITSALDSIVKAQISRFLATKRISPLLAKERRRFLTELATLLNASEWLDVSVLKLNEREIAWHYGFQFQGVLFWYLPTFDVSFEAYSPGACLLNLVHEESRNDPKLKEIDLGIGDEGYKEHIANDQTETVTVHLSRSFASHSKTVLRDVLARAIKSSPGVERSVRSALNRSKNLIQLLIKLRSPQSRKTLVKKAISKFISYDETVFFEWIGDSQQEENPHKLRTLTWEVLADVALQSTEDTETLEYLRRTSHRLRISKQEKLPGFVLLSNEGNALQYFWAADFKDAKNDASPLKTSSQAQAAIIFDCWTPKSTHNTHVYKAAVESLAEELKQQGKTMWISVNPQKSDTLQEIENSAFKARYSIVSRKFIFSMPAEKHIFPQ